VRNLFLLYLTILLVSVFLCGLPICNDHQLFGVSKCENPWWSSGWWECCKLLGHELVLAHYWVPFEEQLMFLILCSVGKFLISSILDNFVYGIMWCLWLSFLLYLWMIVTVNPLYSLSYALFYIIFMW